MAQALAGKGHIVGVELDPDGGKPSVGGDNERRSRSRVRIEHNTLVGAAGR